MTLHRNVYQFSLTHRVRAYKMIFAVLDKRQPRPLANLRYFRSIPTYMYRTSRLQQNKQTDRRLAVASQRCASHRAVKSFPTHCNMQSFIQKRAKSLITSRWRQTMFYLYSASVQVSSSKAGCNMWRHQSGYNNSNNNSIELVNLAVKTWQLPLLTKATSWRRHWLTWVAYICLRDVLYYLWLIHCILFVDVVLC